MDQGKPNKKNLTPIQQKFYKIFDQQKNKTLISVIPQSKNLVIIQPSSGKYSETFIFLLGMGDQNAKVIMIAGIDRYTKIGDDPKNTKKIPNWFNTELTKEGKRRINLDQAKESIKYIDEIIREETKVLGDSKKIVLGGFSQGGVIALHTALMHTQRLGGVQVFSGFYLGVPQFRPCIANEDMPIFIYHGLQDENVSWRMAKETFQGISKRGRQFITHLIPNVDHNIEEEGFLLMRKYFDQFVGRKPLEDI